jgi:hypothetical protein
MLIPDFHVKPPVLDLLTPWEPGTSMISKSQEETEVSLHLEE